MRLILASTSARRKELLSLLQVPFDVVTPAFTEGLRGDLSPEDQARFCAEGKARSCSGRFPEALVLGSDTLLAVDGEILGKPMDRGDARAILSRLRGRDHTIHTAVALLRQNDGTRDLAVETVHVWMRALDDAQISAYVQTTDGMGKAGAYAIQGSGGHLVSHIQGDFTAVVGLPLNLVADLLHARGVTIPVDMEALYRHKPYENWDRFPATRKG